ncbi:hypothetical protein M1O54_00995 [Dehalococcoidia bacterium]|nr:hypothetical protein [Dehalococcoidia bacterium]
MITRALNQPVLMTWMSHFVQFGSAIFVLPLILIRFSTEEIAVWFLFNMIIGIAVLAGSGFGATTVRAVSYFFSGADSLPTNIVEFKNQKAKTGKPNYQKLYLLLSTLGRVYVLLSLLAIALLATIGPLIVSNVVALAGNRTDLWVAFGVLILSSAVRMQSVRWSSFIQGIDQVALIRRLESFISVIRICIYFILLTLGYKILALFIADLLLSIITLLYARHFVDSWFAKNAGKSSMRTTRFDKEIFGSMWPATWRFGLIMLGAYLINYAISLLVAQLDDAALIASFLFTVNILFMIRMISQAPLYANLPRLVQMMAKHDFNNLRRYAGTGIFAVMSLLVSSLLVVGLFGNTILEFFNIGTRLVGNEIFVLLSIWIILEVHHAAHAQIYMTSNHIPFLLPAVLSGIAIVGIGYIVMQSYGLLGLILVQLVVQACCNNWYPVMLSLRLLQWPFKQYIFDVPKFGIQYLAWRGLAIRSFLGSKLA